MRRARDWFLAYSECHQHPVNQRIHYFAVPLIMLSILGLLWEVRVPMPGVAASGYTTAGALLAVLGMVFYLTMRSRPVFFSMLALTSASVFIVAGVASAFSTTESRLLLWGAVFGVSWVLQFIGHGVYEKKRPSFFTDLLFLLVGPAWVAAKLLRLKVARDLS